MNNYYGKSFEQSLKSYEANVSANDKTILDE